jgi:hypothetical protein
VNVALPEAVEIGIGRQPRVEDQFLGWLAGPLLPEIDEAQDLLRLLGLGDAGTSITKGLLCGIACQEREDALLATTATGNVVFFQGFSVAVGRDGVQTSA